MIHDDWDLLIQCYLDGCATDEDCVRFEKIMRDSHEARQRFWELAEVHALAGEAFLISQSVGLEKAEDEEAGNEINRSFLISPLSENAIGNDEQGRIGFAAWASFAAVSCIVLISLVAWRSTETGNKGSKLNEVATRERAFTADTPHPPAPSPRRRGEGEEERFEERFEERLEGGSEEGLARIVESRSGLRRDQDSFFQTGQVLGVERVVLIAGTIEIVLTNGTTIILEGPCDFELVSKEQVILHSGQAVVHVPHETLGFQFDTDNIRVVEASNEFAVRAESESSTTIQVYDGVVQVVGNLNAIQKDPTQVSAGKAVRYTSLRTEQLESIDFSPEKFIRRLSKDVPIEQTDETAWPLFNQPVHEAIAVWRRRGPIVIDGELDDWPSIEGFHSVWEKNTNRREYVTGRMMYDEDNLYVAAHVGDPFPMLNVIGPDTDGDLAWRGGGLQIRLWAERQVEWPADMNSPNYYSLRSLPLNPVHLEKSKNQRVVHLTFWHHALTKKSCLHAVYGMDWTHENDRVNPLDFEGMHRKDDDGQGYVLEYSIPWSLLNASDDPPRSGDRIPFTWTTHWSDESGRVWRGQLNELRNLNEPHRVFSWERAATWGRAEFE